MINLNQLTIIKTILSQPVYLVVALTFSLFLFMVATWLPNLDLIKQTITSPNFNPSQKTRLLLTLFKSIDSNFTPLAKYITLINITLAGLNAGLITYLLKNQLMTHLSMGSSLTGVVASLVGFGCASCGSVILTLVFGLSTSVAVLNLLPLKGQEIGLLGTTGLLVSLYLLTDKLTRASCGVGMNKTYP